MEKALHKCTTLLLPLFKRSQKMFTWNVIILYEAGRVMQVVRKMKSYNILLLGLSETK